MIDAGVDVGGTNIEVGLVDQNNTVLERTKRNTPTEGPDAVIATITDLVASLNETPIAVGVGIPGVVHEGNVLTVPNLSNWIDDVDLKAELEAALGMPVALGNDVNVGLLGEWIAGAAPCAAVFRFSVGLHRDPLRGGVGDRVTDEVF